jgi:hypothetical protein
MTLSIPTFPPVDPTRRAFLSQAAGVAAGGAVLALATIPPTLAVAAPAGTAAKPDPILTLIADHKAAIAATDDAMHHYGLMEESISEDQRQGDMSGGEVTEVATDDPRWTAACHRFNEAFRKSDEIALAMLDAPISSLEGLAALMAYAGEHTLQGLLFPEGIIDDTLDEKPRDWIEWVLIKAATTVRQLCPVVS